MLHIESLHLRSHRRRQHTTRSVYGFIKMYALLIIFYMMVAFLIIFVETLKLVISNNN